MRTNLLSILEPSGYKKAIGAAPPSGAWLVAALLEPAISISVYLLAALTLTGQVQRTDLVLCLLVFVLTFPGRNRFSDSRFDGMRGIAIAWLALLGTLALCGYLTTSLQYFDMNVVLTWALLGGLLQWQALLIGQAVLRRRQAIASGMRKVVMVGAGPLGASVAHALQQQRNNPANFLGWFDDRARERLHSETGTKLLGSLDDLAPYIRRHGVKEVYITLPLSSHPRIAELLESVQGTTASVYYVPDIPGISIIQGRLHDINGVPVLGLYETPFTGINEVVKRASDIVLSLLILLLISPLMLLIAIGVKLSSPGPVLFKQRRNGLDGSEIMVYKFRSMTSQDNGSVIVQASKNDPRITPFGAIIRRTSLDELPQFFNVLQGTMSIVGPRPHAVAHNEMYSQAIKAYMVRHKVRPGITGWAQVNGLRGETRNLEQMRERVEYDLEYLRNWSIWLDLRIILRTILLMFHDRRAY
ncbi:MAG: undecaprenyl-phosphate glucose phosphotransferase [Burkholderiaceae bacterium]|nr:undecaprenyl-phosphate glucose phosphotransferase [Burkholderiaceae bacterium]